MSNLYSVMEEKMKKKFLMTSLVSVMALALCACGNGTGGEDAAVPSGSDENAGQTAADTAGSKDGAATGEDAGPDGGAASENETAPEDDTAA